MQFRPASRIVLVGGACFLAGALTIPAAEAVPLLVSQVFVTNTAANPVPVAPQGTTQISGTVTVANQPATAPIRQPFQATFREKPITNDAPFAVGTFYTVPAGKTLVVEYAQAHYSLLPQDSVRRASIRVGCNPPDEPPGTAPQIFLPQQPGFDTVVVGGPVQMVVPAGRCVTYEIGAISTKIPEGTTSYMYGSISGYLIDAA